MKGCHCDSNAVGSSPALKSASSFKIEKAADFLLNYLTYLSKKDKIRLAA